MGDGRNAQLPVIHGPGGKRVKSTLCCPPGSAPRAGWKREKADFGLGVALHEGGYSAAAARLPVKRTSNRSAPDQCRRSRSQARASVSEAAVCPPKANGQRSHEARASMSHPTLDPEPGQRVFQLAKGRIGEQLELRNVREVWMPADHRRDNGSVRSRRRQHKPARSGQARASAAVDRPVRKLRRTRQQPSPEAFSAPGERGPDLTDTPPRWRRAADRRSPRRTDSEPLSALRRSSRNSR